MVFYWKDWEDEKGKKRMFYLLAGFMGEQ